MSDADDIAAQHRKKREMAKRERERLKHYQQEIQASHQDPQDVQSDASFLEGAFDLLGADTLRDIESAAPSAPTQASREAIDRFVQEVKRGKRANTRKAK